MKAETQAIHLEKMMRKHHLYPEYELILCSVRVKKNVLKKLVPGDLLPLGLHRLEMILLSEENIAANVVLTQSGERCKVKIINYSKYTEESYKSKKYQAVGFSLGRLRTRQLEVGREIEITQLALHGISVQTDGKNIAKGSLVNVNDEIAVQIDKVI